MAEPISDAQNRASLGQPAHDVEQVLDVEEVRCNPTPDQIDQLPELSDDDQRIVFRELAGRLLDPAGDAELTVCDNDGNVLGYFVPVARRMREKAPNAVEIPDVQTFLAGSEPAKDVFDRIKTVGD